MLGALVIVFREVLEAGLIIGIVLAATRGLPGRGHWVTLGVMAGCAGAGVVALFAEAISGAFEGAGQELLNATVLGAAVLMLMWHNAWMARHGREMAADMRAVGQAVTSGTRPMTVLAVVVGLAVLREGAEIVLFLYGVVVSGTSTAALLLGGALGLAAGGLLTGLTYYGLLALPTRHVFTVTTVLIALLAAGMAAQAVAFLERANWLTRLDTVAWDSGWLLSEKSIAGRAMHTLIGYTDQPTEMQLLVYLGVLVVTVMLMRLTAPEQRAGVTAIG